MTKATNLIYGVGFSTDDDPERAAKAAAKQALGSLKGKKPIISYVFFAGDYDPYKLSKALKQSFGDSEFVGGSSDSVFYDDNYAEKGIVVFSIYSKFLHVSIASADNLDSNTQKIAKEVAKEAMSRVQIDHYLDPYMQYTRMKKQDMASIVKIPSYFGFLFSRGLKVPAMGDELTMINSVTDVVGHNIPIFGARLGTSGMNVLLGKPYEIYALHSGKVMKDGIIFVFHSSSLLYSKSIEHGCNRTDKIGFVSKTSGGGFVIDEISGQPIVDWYSKQLGIPKQKFLKDARMITQLQPLGVPDSYGNYIIRGGGIPMGSSLAYVSRNIEGWPVYIMDANKKQLSNAYPLLQTDINAYLGDKKKPALMFATVCVTRKLVQQQDYPKELKKLRKQFGNVPMVGFTCFGEIGGKAGQPVMCHHLTSNIFMLYDQLLHEI